MDIYRCQLCLTPSLLTERPGQCSFCGALRQWVVPADEFETAAVGELSEKSRDSLGSALEIEVEDCRFFRAASQVTDSTEGKAFFDALTRIEACHAAIACRILGIDEPAELHEIGDCAPVHGDNLAEARKRQERSLRRYRRLLEESTGERIEEVLRGLIEVKTAHLQG